MVCRSSSVKLTVRLVVTGGPGCACTSRLSWSHGDTSPARTSNDAAPQISKATAAAPIERYFDMAVLPVVRTENGLPTLLVPRCSCGGFDVRISVRRVLHRNV